MKAHKGLGVELRLGFSLCFTLKIKQVDFKKKMFGLTKKKKVLV